MSIYFVLFLLLIKALGFKLVWTTHDLIPHGNFFVDDIGMMRFLSYIANAKIVHSPSSLKKMADLNMNTTASTIIPIGNYIGLYKPKKKESKSSHSKRSNDEIVFGFFGKIREDKGVVELLKVYNSTKLPKSRLLIVGQCDADLEKNIVLLSKNNKQVKLILKHIPDNQVSDYFNLFDIVVLPFKNITTSSSILLAMSLKKPVICPLMGEIVDVPRNTGIYYDPNNPNGLKESLIYAANHKSELSTLATNAYKYMESIDWENSSLSTTKLYKLLLSK